MENNIKKANDFIRTYNLKKDYTLRDLEYIAERLGYEIFFYQRYNEEHNKILTQVNGLSLSLNTNSFTHEGPDIKFIFINRQLSETEKKITLLHELLHIYSGDTSKREPISVTQEKSTTDLHFIVEFIMKYKNIFRITVFAHFVMISALILCSFILSAPQKSNQPADIVYITPTGYHYHSSDCNYGEDYAYSIRALRADAEKKLLPCSNCKPDK